LILRRFLSDEALSRDDEPTNELYYPLNRFYSYRQILEQRKEAVRDILTALATPGNLPALYHCSAGNGRTCIVSGLLLGLVGVPNETIARDYAHSGEAVFDRYDVEGLPGNLEGEELPRENTSDRFALAEGMMLALEYLSDEYGGIESHIRHVGLTNDHIATT